MLSVRGRMVSATFISVNVGMESSRLSVPKYTFTFIWIKIEAEALLVYQACSSKRHYARLQRQVLVRLDVATLSCISSENCCCVRPYLIAIEAIGEMYRMNRNGPRMDS